MNSLLYLPYGSSPSAPSRSPCRSYRISARIWRSANFKVWNQSMSGLLQKNMFAYLFIFWYYTFGGMRKPIRVIWKTIDIYSIPNLVLIRQLPSVDQQRDAQCAHCLQRDIDFWSLNSGFIFRNCPLLIVSSIVIMWSLWSSTESFYRHYQYLIN